MFLRGLFCIYAMLFFFKTFEKYSECLMKDQKKDTLSPLEIFAVRFDILYAKVCFGLGNESFNDAKVWTR